MHASWVSIVYLLYALITALLLVPGIATSATIYGTVLSSEGGPVAGASVYLPDTDCGATADPAGAFSLDVTHEDSPVLVASAMGFRPDTIAVSATSGALRFVLIPEAIPLPSVTVDRSRVELLERTTAFVARITPDEAPSPAASVPELLDQSVGVQVKTLGGMGSFSTVSVRGSTAEQVRVYLDGIPLNQALGGGVNIAAIPASSIEKVDVYRSVIPPEFGGSGTAGVVDFRTRTPSDSLRWKLSGSYGTWDSRIVNGWFSRGFGPVSGVVTFDYSHSRNDFPFWDDNGTRFNTDDDGWARRTNNQFTSYNVLGRVTYDAPGDWHLTGSYHLTRTRDNLPGVSTAHELENHTNLRTDQYLAEVSVERPLPLMSTLNVQGYRSWRRDRFDNTEGIYALGKKLTDDTTWVWGARLSLATLALPWQRIAVDVSWQHEGFDPDNLLLTDDVTRRQQLIGRTRTQVSAYLSDEVSFFNGYATLTGQMGYQRIWNRAHSDPEVTTFAHLDTTASNHWPRALGLAVRPLPWMQIRANYGRYVRVPNLYELFGDRGTTMGNDELRPESGTNRDIGISLRFGGTPQRSGGTSPRYSGEITDEFRRPFGIRFAQMEAVYFQNTAEDMIVFWQVHGRAKAFNMTSARIRGVEVSGTAAADWGLSLSGNITWQEPLNTSTTQDSMYYGNDLPGRPRWQADIRTDFTLGPVTVFYGVHWHNRFFSQPINEYSEVISAAWLHGAGVRVRIGRYISITGEGKNLGDVKEFHSLFVPLPGRSWFVTLQVGSRAG